MLGHRIKTIFFSQTVQEIKFKRFSRVSNKNNNKNNNDKLSFFSFNLQSFVYKGHVLTCDGASIIDNYCIVTYILFILMLNIASLIKYNNVTTQKISFKKMQLKYFNFGVSRKRIFGNNIVSKF